MRLMGILGLLLVVAPLIGCGGEAATRCGEDRDCPEGAKCNVELNVCGWACAEIGCTPEHYCEPSDGRCNSWVPLESLTISAGTLVPMFATEVTSYTATVACAHASLTVTPTAGDARSTITVNGVTVASGSESQAIQPEVGRTEIEIVVTAVDGITTKTYALSVDRQDAEVGQWVTITPGTDPFPASFMMGSPVGEVGRLDADETPHAVMLTHPFEILSTEVTQAEFVDRMGYNPSDFDTCSNCPVQLVSWHEAAAYCNALSGTTYGHCYDCIPDSDPTKVICAPSTSYASPYECPGYRLPTEAEWEYAARAGDPRATYNGDLVATDCSSNDVLNLIAWYCGNSGATTHSVATKKQNAWGLYDMLGNVNEWCNDRYGPYQTDPSPLLDPWDPPPPVFSNRVFRGGSWGGNASSARAANRDFFQPEIRYNLVGFRPVRSLPE
jgi:sulfatase modifying factor 1